MSLGAEKENIPALKFEVSDQDVGIPEDSLDMIDNVYIKPLKG